ncbi:MAG: hypothetical protein ACXAC2_16745 [Candidatus Kariarchaeaceae archaeon]|jgi:hypothetical protein
MVTSSFCSKCHYNRKLWKEVSNSEINLREINIAEEKNRQILQFLKPEMAPTIYVIYKEKIIYQVEGVIDSKTILSIIEIFDQLEIKEN